MVLKAENTQILVKTGAAQAGLLKASNTNMPNSVVNGGEVGAPVDAINSTNNTSVQTKTVRSKQQLLDSLKFCFSSLNDSLL